MQKRKFTIEFGKAQDHSIGYLSGILEDARITTLQVVSKIPAVEVDWQFKAGWNKIGALLSHIIAIEHFFRIEFVEGRKLTVEENDKWLPGMEMGSYIPQLIQNLPIETYMAELTRSRHLMMQALKQVSFDKFIQRIEEYDPVTGCNQAWVLYHMVEDEIISLRTN